MAIHPYATPQPSDEYFVKLAGRLYKAVMLSGMPEAFRKKCVSTWRLIWKM